MVSSREAESGSVTTALIGGNEVLGEARMKSNNSKPSGIMPNLVFTFFCSDNVGGKDGSKIVCQALSGVS